MVRYNFIELSTNGIKFYLLGDDFRKVLKLYYRAKILQKYFGNSSLLINVFLG